MPQHPQHTPQQTRGRKCIYSVMQQLQPLMHRPHCIQAAGMHTARCNRAGRSSKAMDVCRACNQLHGMSQQGTGHINTTSTPTHAPRLSHRLTNDNKLLHRPPVAIRMRHKTALPAPSFPASVHASHNPQPEHLLIKMCCCHCSTRTCLPTKL
jgi:hypothetical protein